MSSPRPFRRIKIILLGESKVGKTSIYQRFMNDGFREKYVPTDGVDGSSQMAEVNGHVIQVELVSVPL
jgi:GTPase SAR1 family protein